MGFNLTVATAFCFALAHDAMATSSPQRRQSERPTTPSYFSERGKGLLVLKVGTSSLMVSDMMRSRISTLISGEKRMNYLPVSHAFTAIWVSHTFDYAAPATSMERLLHP